MKWSNFTSHEKDTRIKIVIASVGFTSVLIYTMGINDFISLLGTMTFLGGIIYFITEIKSWFKNGRNKI